MTGVMSRQTTLCSLIGWAAQYRASASLDGLLTNTPNQNASKRRVADFERSFSDLGTTIDIFCQRHPGCDRTTVLKVAFAHVLALRGFTSTPVFGVVAGSDSSHERTIGPCSLNVDPNTSLYVALAQAAEKQTNFLPLAATLEAGIPVWGATLEYASATQELGLGEELLPNASLHLAFRESATTGAIELRCLYAPAVLPMADVAVLIRHVYATALQIARCERPQKTIFADIDVKSEHERSSLLHNFCHAAKKDSPRVPGEFSFIHEYVQAHASTTPNAIAVETAQDRLSYRQLDSVSNSLAHRLRATGVQPGQHVGVFMSKSSRLFVAIVAILKVGACVTPLGIENPAAKNMVILNQTAAPCILADERTALMIADNYDLASLSVVPRVLDVSIKGWHPTADTAKKPVPVNYTAETPAYIIYTSGTTGEPKGVLLSHANVVSFIRAQIEGWDLDRTSRVLQLSNYVWDVSIGETVSAFSTGCCLYVVERMEAAADLSAVMERARITHTIMTPTFARLLDPVPKCLQAIFVTGEPLPVSLRNYLLPQVPSLINGGAPSEVTILALATKLDKNQMASPWTPFGKPMGDVNAYVLDEHLNIVPIGAVGELCLSGKQVSAGYLKKPDITARVFLPNPFRTTDKSEVLYRTGDLARLRADGIFELLGRSDGQIKFHGIRLESVEIESAIMSSTPDVTLAGVAISNLGEVSKLVAFVVLRDHYKAGEAQLVKLPELHHMLDNIKRHVGACLSSHAVPSQFWALYDLPRTPSGKIDRRALSALASELAMQQAAAPVTPPAAPTAVRPIAAKVITPATPPYTPSASVLSIASKGLPRLMTSTSSSGISSPEIATPVEVGDPKVERIVRDTLAQVLQLDLSNIARDAGFLELGGDSLGAIRLSIALRKLGYEIDVRTLYEAASLSGIAARLKYPAVTTHYREDSRPSVTSDTLSVVDQPLSTVSHPVDTSKGAADLVPVEFAYVLYKHSIPRHIVQDAFYGTAYQRGSLLMAYGCRLPRPKSIEWNSLTVDVKGDPTARYLQSCWAVLVSKHTALRTVLARTQSIRVANIVLWPEYCRGEWVLIDGSHGTPEQQDRKVDEAVTEQLERGYTMGTLPWRMVYARATKTRPAKLIWNFAHSSLDGWSLSILNDALTNLLNGKDIESSSYRAYADFIAARDTRKNVRWFRQNLLPLSSPCWPIAEPSKLKSEPVCETLFYTEWNLDFNRLSKALGVTPFAAALAAVALTIGQRERSLDTDGAVTMGYISSGRNFELEGVENIAGCCLDLMLAKLNPRMDKSGRTFLDEAQTIASTQMGRDHCLYELLDPERKPTANLQVCLVYQNFLSMSAFDGAESDKYAISRSVERMPTCCALMLEIFPSAPQADGNQTWSVRCSYDRSVVSTEKAAEFVDDAFVHIRWLLLRSEEDIAQLAVLSSGQYEEELGGLVPYVPPPVYERQHESFYLPADPPMTALIRLFVVLFTALMFNIRLSLANRMSPVPKRLTAPTSAQ